MRVVVLLLVARIAHAEPRIYREGPPLAVSLAAGAGVDAAHAKVARLEAALWLMSPAEAGTRLGVTAGLDDLGGVAVPIGVAIGGHVRPFVATVGAGVELGPAPAVYANARIGVQVREIAVMFEGSVGRADAAMVLVGWVREALRRR